MDRGAPNPGQHPASATTLGLRESGNVNDQPLADRQWGSGFLPTKYQGVKFRSLGDPVLYLSNPAGFSATQRRRFIDDVASLNQL